MKRTLYTWHASDYHATRYADPEETISIAWVYDKGGDCEASGSTECKAALVQAEIETLERSGHIVESITRG